MLEPFEEEFPDLFEIALASVFESGSIEPDFSSERFVKVWRRRG